MDIRKKQRAVVDALEDIKGRDIVVLDTQRLTPEFERVIIASGDSTRQVKALADNVQEKLKKLGARICGVEGGDSAEWVLVDLGDIVVHVMHPAVRAYYTLEEIWGGREVRLRREPGPASRAAAKPKNASPRSKARQAPAQGAAAARKPRARALARPKGPKAVSAAGKRARSRP